MSKSGRVKQTNSGVEKEGEWQDVSEFAEKVEEAMEKSGVEEDSVEKFEEWRPREDEDEEDVKEKTVETSVMPEKKLEKESKGVKRDMEEASETVAKVGERVKKAQNPEGEIKEASKDAVKPFYSIGVKMFRKFEETVYSKIMLRWNAYYCDTKDFSVSMEPKRDGKYKMGVNVPEKDKRKGIQKDLVEEE